MIGFCKICALGIFFLENNSFKMNLKISVWKETSVYIYFLPWTVFLGPGLAGKLSQVAFLRAHDPIFAHKDLNPLETALQTSALQELSLSCFVFVRNWPVMHLGPPRAMAGPASAVGTDFRPVLTWPRLSGGTLGACHSPARSREEGAPSGWRAWPKANLHSPAWVHY